ALGFVEDHDVLRRRSRVGQSIIAEVVHVLDKGLDALADPTFANFLALRLAAGDFVAGERLAQYGDEWTVAGEEDSVGGSVLIAALRGDVKADKRLAGAGNSGHETYDLAASGAGLI